MSFLPGGSRTDYLLAHALLVRTGTIRVVAVTVAGSALALGAIRLDAEGPTFADNTAAAIGEFRAALALARLR
jgi:hypothetical protein